MKILGPVSEVYVPREPMEAEGTRVVDEPVTAKYHSWGYTIGYLVDAEGKNYPEGCNTAIFRIAPGGMTEPVFVTKLDEGAVFEVDSVTGVGKAIVARASGVVEEVDFDTDRVEIRPGDAYSYINTGDEDLVLYDLATPAFREGDDVEITSSVWPLPEGIKKPQSGSKTSVVELVDGSFNSVELPNEFWDALFGAPFRGSIIRAADAEVFERGGFTGRVFVSKEESVGFNAMQIDVHGSHPDKKILEGNTRCYYVAEGSGVFTLNGEDYVANGGEFFVIPAGGEYSYSGSMRLLEFNVSPDNSFGDERLS